MTDATAKAVAFLLTNSTFPSPLSTDYRSAAPQKAPARKRGSPAGQQKPTARSAAAAKRLCQQPPQQQQKLRPPMLSTVALRIFSAGKHGTSSSSGIRTHTPDPEDIPCSGLRKRACRTAAHASPSTGCMTAHASPSTDPAGYMDPAAPAQAHAREAHASLHAAAGALPGLHASPAPVLTAAAGIRRAEPFSIGVQWDAYHKNPTPDMPGYPAGYWQAESSPFAAMASNPVWEEDVELQQVPEKAGNGGSSAADVNAAAWGYDSLHLAHA